MKKIPKMRCTYHKDHSPECGHKATRFYKLKGETEPKFLPGAEGRAHGGYLSRCPEHHYQGGMYEKITREEYIVSQVMVS
ncbi:MAG: hypothetical protein ACRD6W_01835 [Nitrososphaerales archaeon]